MSADRPGDAGSRVDAVPRHGAKRGWNIVVVLLLVVAVGLIVGWVLTSSEDGSTLVSRSAIQATCQQVAAVLSDGPAAGADPVGYAEAQVLPLKRIKAADEPLAHAISSLAAAYSAYFHGPSAATAGALKHAAKKLTTLCPHVVASP